MSRRQSVQPLMSAAPLALRSISEHENAVLEDLIVRMSDPAILASAIIPWGSPVPAFGDLAASSVATLGLNPSNREFVDEGGNELDGHNRRFHTLRSLRLRSWAEATSSHYNLIDDTCRRYFSSNPYDGWFRKLDRVISGTGTSYYSGSACHLDLIPYATACKWTELTNAQRETLLDRVGDTLGLLLRGSPVQLLILNGRTVVDRFETMTKTRLRRRVFPSWALPRRSEPDVQGVGYEGMVDTVGGITLGRSIVVLGFNHNIQSSFGVTRGVTQAIASWITRAGRLVLQ
jgi:hypothetical protein